MLTNRIGFPTHLCVASRLTTPLNHQDYHMENSVSTNLILACRSTPVITGNCHVNKFSISLAMSSSTDGSRSIRFLEKYSTEDHSCDICLSLIQMAI